MNDNATKNVTKHDLVVKRIIDVPLETAWKAWTEPELVRRWWGPQFYTSPSAKIDLREGGQYIFGMRAPAEQGGQDSYVAGIYTKIVTMERLEFTQSVTDKDGSPMDPALMGLSPDIPEEMYTTVVFKTKGEMTELTITEYGWTPGPMMVYSLAGLHQMVDKLAEAFGRDR